MGMEKITKKIGHKPRNSSSFQAYGSKSYKNWGERSFGYGSGTKVKQNPR
jgi:hypothetical protein